MDAAPARRPKPSFLRRTLAPLGTRVRGRSRVVRSPRATAGAFWLPRKPPTPTLRPSAFHRASPAVATAGVSRSPRGATQSRYRCSLSIARGDESTMISTVRAERLRAASPASCAGAPETRRARSPSRCDVRRRLHAPKSHRSGSWWCRAERCAPIFAAPEEELPDFRVGTGPAMTPVLSTDVCNLRFSVQRTSAPVVSAHSASHFPHDTGAVGSRRRARFGEPARSSGCVVGFRCPTVRTSDTPSLSPRFGCATSATCEGAGSRQIPMHSIGSIGVGPQSRMVTSGSNPSA